MLARRTLALFLAPTLALSALGAPVNAALEPPKSLEAADPNAALRYWSAWAITSPDVLEKTSAVDWTPIAKETKAAKMSKEFQEAAALDYDKVVDLLLVAAGTARCDFELRYDEGIDLMLPQLGKMRSSARLLRLDARKHLIAGDADGAAARVAAMARMADHLKSDRILISSLVGVAIASLGLAETDLLLASGRLSEAVKADLLEAWRTLDNPDPAGIRGALAFEKISTANWVRRRFTGTNAGRDLAEFCTETLSEEPENFHALALTPLDEAGVGAELGRMGKAFDDALAAWDAPDAQERLAAIGEKISAGEYGELAAILAPATTKVRSSAEKFRTELRATIARFGGTGAPEAGGASRNGAGR